jgi:hypothetical protein
MQEKGLTKTAMAQEMNTNRASLNRFLDPENTSVTLNTMVNAAKAVGKRLRIELVSSTSIHRQVAQLSVGWACPECVGLGYRMPQIFAIKSHQRLAG